MAILFERRQLNDSADYRVIPPKGHGAKASLKRRNEVNNRALTYKKTRLRSDCLGCQ